MIQFAEKGSPHVIEDPCLMPVSQTSPTRGRARILSGKILPSRSSLEYPEYSLKARTVIRWGTSSLRPRWPRGNELSDPLPLLIGQHRFTHTHRITSDQCVTRKARLVQVLFQRYFGNIEVLKLALYNSYYLRFVSKRISPAIPILTTSLRIELGVLSTNLSRLRQRLSDLTLLHRYPAVVQLGKTLWNR